MLGDSSWDEIDQLGRRLRGVWATFARTGVIDYDIAAGLPVRWNVHASEHLR